MDHNTHEPATTPQPDDGLDWLRRPTDTAAGGTVSDREPVEDIYVEATITVKTDVSVMADDENWRQSLCAAARDDVTWIIEQMDDDEFTFISDSGEVGIAPGKRPA